MTLSPEPNRTRLDELLQLVLAELGRTVRRDQLDPWFRDLRIASANPARCVFVVPTTFVRDWLRRNHLARLATAVRCVHGFEECTVTLESKTSLPATAKERLAPSMTRFAERRDAVEGQVIALQGVAADGTFDSAPRAIVIQGRESLASPSPADRSGQHRVASNKITSEPTSGPEHVVSASQDRVPPELEQRGPGHDGDAFPPLGRPSMNSARERDESDDDQGPTDPDRGEAAREYEGEGSRPLGRFGAEPVGERGPVRRLGPSDASCELNRNYTFDQFVVGPCNRLSHASALAVGDNPGHAYNPLFIHGNVGLGKTHLLQAICHEIRRKDENSRVLYLSCEEFTNRFIKAIQHGRLEDFRNLHRTADVLVIDDIQFLAGKDKTQDEFFHTFNALYNGNRQIVLSSDRRPTEIPTVEERLVSRFKWGLVVEMEVPCLETRAAIVRRKARVRQVEISEDVAFLIAKRIDTNIRELEGAINKVLGVAQITERSISVELVEEALRGVITARSRPVSVSDVISQVTAEFSVTARELTGKGRAQTVSLPRQVCMYVARQLTDLSYEEIGRSFSDRDHTTVLYAVKKIDRRVKEDRMFRELVQSLMARLRSM